MESPLKTVPLVAIRMPVAVVPPSYVLLTLATLTVNGAWLIVQAVAGTYDIAGLVAVAAAAGMAGNIVAAVVVMV